MFDIFHKKQMHDNVITRKKMLLQIGTASYPCFWWVIISILCLFIRFMCIRLKTAIWLFSTFWDKVWLFLVNTGWRPRCSTAVKKNCFVQIVCHCTPTNYVVQVKYTPTRAPLRCLLYNRAHRIYHYIPRNEIKMFTHIKLPIWSEHLMPWWESISMPLFNDVHLYPTFLSAHFNWLIPFWQISFFLQYRLRNASAWEWLNAAVLIGVGASKRRIFPEFPPNLPGKLLCDFCLQFFSHNDHEDLYWCDLQKTGFVCFSTNVGRHFLKSNNVGRDFVQLFRNV